MFRQLVSNFLFVSLALPISGAVIARDMGPCSYACLGSAVTHLQNEGVCVGKDDQNYRCMCENTYFKELMLKCIFSKCGSITFGGSKLFNDKCSKFGVSITPDPEPSSQSLLSSRSPTLTASDSSKVTFSSSSHVTSHKVTKVTTKTLTASQSKGTLDHQATSTKSKASESTKSTSTSKCGKSCLKSAAIRMMTRGECDVFYDDNKKSLIECLCSHKHFKKWSKSCLMEKCHQSQIDSGVKMFNRQCKPYGASLHIPRNVTTAAASVTSSKTATATSTRHPKTVHPSVTLTFNDKSSVSAISTTHHNSSVHSSVNTSSTSSDSNATPTSTKLETTSNIILTTYIQHSSIPIKSSISTLISTTIESTSFPSLPVPILNPKFGQQSL